MPTTDLPKKPSTIWVLQITGKGDKKLLEDAFKVLKETEGIRVLYEATFILGLMYGFEKDDDVELPIIPYEEKWGYVKGEGARMLVKECEKKF